MKNAHGGRTQKSNFFAGRRHIFGRGSDVREGSYIIEHI
jgi:hypothetical protein